MKLRVKIDTFVQDTIGSRYSAYELETADVVEDNVNEIYRKDKFTIGFRVVNATVDKCTMSIVALTRLADDIDRSTYFGSYTDVKNDNEWKTLYDQSTRSVTVKFDTTWKAAFADVIPCYYCGFALPVDLVEIDHWFEKANASDKIQALLKIFRTVGANLTVGAATGDKGTQATAIMSGGAITAIGTRNTGPALTNGRLNARRKNFAANKRKLTDLGRLALSTFFAAWYPSPKDDFLRLFVNNFFNLVPACGACNKAKNNRV